MSGSTGTPVPRTPWVRLLLALVLLHATVALGIGRFEGAADRWWRLTPDLLVLLTMSTLLCLRFGYRLWIGHAMVLGLLWIPLFRVPHRLFPEMFGRQFVLLDEVGQVTGLWNAVLVDRPDSPERWYAVLGLLVALAVWTALYYLCRFVGRQLARPVPAGVTLGLAAAALVGAFVEQSIGAPRHSAVFNDSVYGATARQLRHLDQGRALAPQVQAAAERLAAVPQDLGRLGSADLVVYFVESYGRSLVRHPHFGAPMRRVLARAEADLARAGGASASLWVRVQVSGALSQVSHAALLSGVSVNSYRETEHLRRHRPRMLTHVLHDRGYRCLHVNPKLEVDWPSSREWFGFDEDLFGKDTPYRAAGGPVYHWACAPDQYFLALVRRRLLGAERPPAFVLFLGGLTHAPFSRIPPVLTDWERAVEPSAYPPRREIAATIFDYHATPGIEDAYLDTLDVTFAVLTGFVCSLERPVLVLALGDHQAPKTGAIVPDPEDFAVPLHALTNRPELVAPLLEAGAVKGMAAGPGARELSIHELLPVFLRAYAGSPR